MSRVKHVGWTRINLAMPTTLYEEIKETGERLHLEPASVMRLALEVGMRSVRARLLGDWGVDYERREK